MQQVLILQHHPVEMPGHLADVLAKEGIRTRTFRVFEDSRLPGTPDNADGLVVMGGPMGVHEQDRYPFLRDEMRLIEQAVARQMPIPGICLGSQLLAAALGARVAPGPRREIGWHPVTLTADALQDPLWRGLPTHFTAFHWHGDVFDLPHGAVPLARSALTACQAFRFGESAWGLLFHVEVTGAQVAAMVEAFPGDLRAAASGSSIVKEAATNLPALKPIAEEVFRRWTHSG